jgi:iron-sulfur cluster assembly protein
VLGLTNAALESIRDLLGGLPDGAGLRVSLEQPENGHEPEFGLTVAMGPEDEDDVVELEGARVFLEPGVSGYFDDKVLDAEGERFMLRADGA